MKLKINVKEIYCVSNLRAEKCVIVSLIIDLKVFESLVYNGVEFPWAGAKISDCRMDRLNITARLVAVPP